MKILDKVSRADKERFELLKNKMMWIRINPFHRFKFLKHDKKGKNRIHIGHYVLIFRIDHNNKTIYFDDYEHHDKIYIKK